MADTTYLDQIAGTYLRSDDLTTELTIERRNTTLFLSIPGRAEYELVPILSIYFGVKDDPGVKIIVFIDPQNVIQGINVQSKNKIIMAARKRT